MGKELANDLYILNLLGHHFVAVKDATTVSDFKVVGDNQYLSAGELFTDLAVYGDWIDIKIVDIDNVLGYGAGTVLRQYIEKFYVNPDDNLNVQSPYAGNIPKNVYIRITYHSVGTTSDVKVFINLFFHTKVR